MMSETEVAGCYPEEVDMSEQKSTIAEPQKSPGAPPKKPQPIARAQDPDAGTGKASQQSPKPTWQPGGPKK